MAAFVVATILQMREIFTENKSRRSLEIAQKALPVLVFYASILQRPITYQELAYLVGAHQRNFRHPFGYIHEWMEILGNEIGEKIPPIPLLVFEKGKETPAAGGVNWLMNYLGETSEGLSLQSAPRKDLMIQGAVEKIKQYEKWPTVLNLLELPPYTPPHDDIDDVVKRLIERGGQGESPAHEKLKLLLAGHPELIGIRDKIFRTEIEFCFPSLDRVDILFETESSEWICVEVKTIDADEVELTRGMYQCLKYEALASGMKRDLARAPKVKSILATEARLSPALLSRKLVLGIEVVDVISTSSIKKRRS